MTESSIINSSNELMINERSDSIYSLNLFSTVMALFVVFFSIIPETRVIKNNSLIGLLAMTSWFVISFIKHPFYFLKLNTHKAVSFFLIIYTIIFPYMFGNAVIGNRYISISFVILFYFMYDYNAKYNKIENKIIIAVTIPLVIYTAIRTFIALSIDYRASRMIKTEGTVTEKLRNMGIGGYEFIYFIVFLYIILFYAIVNFRKMKIGSVYLSICIFFEILLFLTILYSNYFTALIMISLSSLLIITLSKKHPILNFYLYFASFVIIIQIKSLFVRIIDLLVKYMEKGYTVDRLLYLKADILGQGGSLNIADGRVTTLENSISAISNNPIFGITTTPIPKYGGLVRGFGQHSQFLDTMALFGIAIGLLYVYVILYPLYKRININSPTLSLKLSILLSVIILFLMNNATPSIGFGIFFVYIYADTIFSKKISLTKVSEEDE